MDGLGFSGRAGGCCHLRSGTELRGHQCREKPSAQLRGNHSDQPSLRRRTRPCVPRADPRRGLPGPPLTRRSAQMGLLHVHHPRPLQPVPRALGGGASVLRRSPRSHQDPDLREGGRWEEGQVKPNTGAAGAHPIAVLGSSSRGHRRPAGPCPIRVRGDTPPCPLPGGPGHNPRPAPQRPRPLQSCPGHPPKPLPPQCLRCSKGTKTE